MFSAHVTGLQHDIMLHELPDLLWVCMGLYDTHPLLVVFQRHHADVIHAVPTTQTSHQYGTINMLGALYYNIIILVFLYILK